MFNVSLNIEEKHHGSLHHSGHHGHHSNTLEHAVVHATLDPFDTHHHGHHNKHHGHHNKHHGHHGHHSSTTLEHAVVHSAVNVAGAAMMHGAVHAMEHSLDHHHHNKHHSSHHSLEHSVEKAAIHTAVHTAGAMAAMASMVVPAIVSPVLNVVAEFIDTSNRIYITLNQPSYVGGDVVSGTVELDCLVPFFAKGVLLKVKGFERVWWEHQETEFEGEGQNRKAVVRTREHKENKEFFRDTIRVYPQQGTVGAGHYSFPFTYQLPANLPGTYCDEGGHHGERYHAKVLYKLKATLDVAFRHDLNSTTKLVVNEKFDQLVKPSFAENNKSFLTSTGHLHIRTWLDKNAYFPGETVMAKLKANNTSVKPTRKIVIRVVHCLELKAHGHVKRVSRVEYEKQFSGFDPCYYGVKWMPFSIPVGLIRPSSLMGNHVHSSYLFHIECDIPAATDLSVALPVRILAPQFLWSAAPPQPTSMVLPPTVLIRPPWQPDDQAPNCNSCHAGFSLFNRRHHCRHCAKVFCGKCVSQKMPIPKLKYKDPVRVCVGCVPTAQSGGRKYQSTKEVMSQWQVSQGLADANGASSPVLAGPVF